ncbi:MAG: hypothetical protein DRJ42_04655 [Deltaproteobacteria bacterium]|nr:MAG: hypothetical protein DRJ42_04655 [Deltaproteobacteria bacterium]
MRVSEVTALLLFLLFVTVPISGCLGQVGGVAPGAGDANGALRLVGEIAAGATIDWSLENASEEMASVGCEGGWCAFPVMRVEALQGDGSWQERYAYVAGSLRGDGPREIWPAQAAALGGIQDLDPGTYRVIARAEGFDGPVDVVRELAVVGWSEETMSRGQALLERAEAEGCARVASDISRALLSNIEPDLVLDLLRDAGESAEDEDEDEAEAREWERWRVLVEMVQRGMFVTELGDEVRQMAVEDAVSFAGLVSRHSSARQQPVLRRTVAARLMDAVDDWDAPLEVDLLQKLSSFEEQWPPHAPETLVARLDRGPESGLALAGLIDVLVYAPRGLFAADSTDILRILEARCDGVTEEELVSACERGIYSFTPGFNGMYGRGFGTSSGCGGGWGAPTGVCGELSEEWQAIALEVGVPRAIFLGASVEAVPGAEGAEGDAGEDGEPELLR